ncbi:MAG: hypothetical protein FWE12_00675 [Oscillospiraceae bacterium]|nr:hypothetical protein [Oscillospiraceae bacterium]
MNIVTFPLDVTDYTADALGAWFAARTRGVFAADGHYHITTNGNMTVTVGTGLAWLRMTEHWGVVAFNQNPVVLEVPPAENATHRVDAVCLRLDKAANLSRLVLKPGTPGINRPAPPVRDASFDEIYLATIRIPAGAASIEPIHIADQRLNEQFCGIMSDGTNIPTQQLYDTWMDWFRDLKTVLEEDTAGKLYNRIEGLLERMDRVETAMQATAVRVLMESGRHFTEFEDVVRAGAFMSDSAGWQSFEFPYGGFDGTPTVTATAMNHNGYVSINNVTKTGFEYCLKNTTGKDIATATQIHYQAIYDGGAY